MLQQLLPKAPRASRPHRVNFRVILGVGLILVSALGSWGMYRVVTSSASILVATRLLVEGEQLSQGDVRSQDVPAGAVGSEYFSDPTLVVGKVVTRVVHPGELIPRASIGEASETIQTTLAIDVTSAVASSLREGAIVDVWAAASARSSNPSVAGQSVPHAVVYRARLAHKQETAGGVANTERVEIVLPRAAVPDVLQAVANGDSLTVVASSGGLNS